MCKEKNCLNYQIQMIWKIGKNLSYLFKSYLMKKVKILEGRIMISRLKIIIADDNKIITTVLAEEIKKHEEFLLLDITSRTEDEIELINTLKPDTVITDIKRKEGYLKGLEIIRMYREQEKPKFVVISGAPYTDIMESLRELKVKYFIPKPFQYEKVIEVLREVREEIYPQSVLDRNDMIQEFKRATFFERLAKILKRK